MTSARNQPIDWQYLDPLLLQDLRYAAVLLEVLGDPAHLPLPIARVFERAVSADAWEDAADEVASAEALLQAKEFLDEAIENPDLSDFADRMLEASRKLRADFIAARKIVEPTWAMYVEWALGMPRDAAPPKLLPLFEAADATDRAQSDLVELTGIRLLAARTESLLIAGVDRDSPGLEDFKDRLRTCLPDDLLELDQWVNLASALPVDADSYPQVPWAVLKDEVDDLLKLHDAARTQEASNAATPCPYRNV